MESMDLDLHPTAQKFPVGGALANFLVSSEIPHKACQEIAAISEKNVDSFHLKVEKVEEVVVVYVTFPSFDKEEFFVTDTTYGECSVENTVFSAFLKGDDGQPARVHKGALRLFQHIVETQDFKDKTQEFWEKTEKTIIFVGHSMGGAVATLATLWLLEKRKRHLSPFCITFGSPLVGDFRLGQAIRWKDWSGKFCHVVSKYDIVPRMLLAPIESIAQPLNVFFSPRGRIMGNQSIDSSHPSTQEACRDLLNTVLQYTSTIANTDPGESDFGSPYRPSGTYMLCSSYGAACIEDPEAVLKMLVITLQSTDGNEIANACISGYTGYGDMLKHITGKISSAKCISDSPIEMGIALQLEAMDVDAQNVHAFGALTKAEDIKNKNDKNNENLNNELTASQSKLAELEGYIKESCKNNGAGYYDVFKNRGERRDFSANLRIKYLANFWDEIVDMVEKHESPGNFRVQNKWINAGTAYRRLAEPLDIAEYYRTHNRNESYLSNEARPKRHKALEKWLKEKDETRSGRVRNPRTMFASLTEDSCFWARLEEARKALENLQQEPWQHQVMNTHELKESLAEFENYVWSMIADKSISVEVFLEGSSFMIWWQQCILLQLQSNPHLFNFMEKKGWMLTN